MKKKKKPKKTRIQEIYLETSRVMTVGRRIPNGHLTSPMLSTPRFTSDRPNTPYFIFPDQNYQDLVLFESKEQSDQFRHGSQAGM